MPLSIGNLEVSSGRIILSPSWRVRLTARTNSPRESIFRDLIVGLYEGRYAPGQRLTEAQLASTYNASRGPVREALNRLEAAGVVDLTLQRGACIRKLSLKESLDSLIIAEGLVSIAARFAAQNVEKDGARERMTAALDDVVGRDPSDAPNDPNLARARDSFYGTLTALSENSQLGRAMPSVQIHLLRVQFAKIIREADLWRHEDYRKIAEAVISGDGDAAEAAVHAHFSRVIKLFTDQLAEQGADGVVA